MKMSIQTNHYLKLIILFIIVNLMTGCSTLSYYSQSIQGQLEVIEKSESISTLLSEDKITPEEREKLNIVLALREFSIKELGLPNNKSYSAYADLGRDYVIWNIFANPEFSLEPVNWCYFIVGCLSYRGYFSKQDAKQHEDELKQQGFDTYLGGVSAYSTLGWFNDPVLNSMLRWNESYLASVMFHELAHQQLYIKDDTELNESYADAVAYIGVTKWLVHKQDETQMLEYKRAQDREKQFVNLINKYKPMLIDLYESEIDDESKRVKKLLLLKQLQNDYSVMSKNWNKNPYKKWISTDLNNAKLASIITYRKYVPDFIKIYEKLNRDLPAFYSFAKALSNCNKLNRKKILEATEIEFNC